MDSKKTLQEFADWLGLKFVTRDGFRSNMFGHTRYAQIGEGQKASWSSGKTESEACDKLWEFVKNFYVVIQQ